MSTPFYPQSGQLARNASLAVLPGTAPLASAIMQLFTNNIVPNPLSVPGDFTAPVFAGYADFTIPAFFLGITPQGVAELRGDIGTFQPSASVGPLQVYGYILYKGSVLYCVEIFDAPFNFSSPLTLLQIIYREQTPQGLGSIIMPS